MKNISRRVFIKGLAVAGVAAAASTVLAGCNTNMIPGVEEPTEEPTTTAQTLTFADPADADKTVSITLSDLKIDNVMTNGLALKLSAKVVNDAQAKVAFVSAYKDNATGLVANDYQVVVTAYPDAVETNTDITAQAGTTNAKDNLLVDDNVASVFSTASASTGTVTNEGSLYLTINNDDLKWSKVTVKMEVFKVVKTDATDEKQPVKTLKYTFSK